MVLEMIKRIEIRKMLKKILNKFKVRITKKEQEDYYEKLAELYTSNAIYNATILKLLDMLNENLQTTNKQLNRINRNLRGIQKKLEELRKTVNEYLFERWY